MASQNITMYTHRRVFRNQRRTIVRYDVGLQCASTRPVSLADWVFKPRRKQEEITSVLATIASTSIDSYWEESVPPRSDACYRGSPEANPPSGR